MGYVELLGRVCYCCDCLWVSCRCVVCVVWDFLDVGCCWMMWGGMFWCWRKIVKDCCCGFVGLVWLWLMVVLWVFVVWWLWLGCWSLLLVCVGCCCGGLWCVCWLCVVGNGFRFWELYCWVCFWFIVVVFVGVCGNVFLLSWLWVVWFLGSCWWWLWIVCGNCICLGLDGGWLWCFCGLFCVGLWWLFVYGGLLCCRLCGWMLVFVVWSICWVRCFVGCLLWKVGCSCWCWMMFVCVVLERV